jgi:hypothetical protein
MAEENSTAFRLPVSRAITFNSSMICGYMRLARISVH